MSTWTTYIPCCVDVICLIYHDDDGMEKTHTFEEY